MVDSRPAIEVSDIQAPGREERLPASYYLGSLQFQQIWIVQIEIEL